MWDYLSLMDFVHLVTLVYLVLPHHNLLMGLLEVSVLEEMFAHWEHPSVSLVPLEHSVISQV
jgi:hypothetical protein